MDYALAYVFSGFMGYVIEKYYFVKENPCGDTMNRKFLNICMPFLNVWAVGGVIVVFLLNHLQNMNIILLTLIATVILSILECCVGKLTFKINGSRSWFYEPYKCTTCDGFVSLWTSAHWFVFSLTLIYIYKFYKKFI